jgi:hypothetical protein
VAIDAIPGGAKVTRQARALGWPAALRAEELTDEALGEAWDWCLTADARERARSCVERARVELRELERRFAAALSDPTEARA